MRVRDPSETPDAYLLAFVCTGNVCRSAAAEIMFESMLQAAGLDRAVAVLSAGTSGAFRDDEIDPRARQWLIDRGYSDPSHRVRQFDASWLSALDLTVVLDRTNRRTLWNWAGSDGDDPKIALLLSFDPELAPLQDVPDPYFSDDPSFARVMATIEQACRSLLVHVRDQLSASTPKR